jgi:ATP-dependent RNA helicase DDX18/HAS1
VLIIAPTRELCDQIYSIACALMLYHKQNCGLLVGRTNCSAQAYKLFKGVNLVVATPGCLLDHLLPVVNTWICPHTCRQSM